MTRHLLLMVSVVLGPRNLVAAEPGWRTIPLADREAAVGTSHPSLILASSVGKRWASICEARMISVEQARQVKRDDARVSRAMVPYLVRGGGEGQRIDEWVTASPDDRWLVFLRDGALILLDDAGDRERTLVAAPVPTLRDGSHRVAAFDATSHHVAYLRSSNAIVIRDLATNAERTINIPNDIIARIVPEPAGSWARILLKREGNDDAEQRYEPPLPPLPGERPSSKRIRHSSDSGTCFPRTSTWSYGLQGAQRWLNLDTGELRDDPEVQARLGDVTIRQTRAGALTSDGVELVPASCAAKVRAVSLAPLRIVASCTRSGENTSLEVFGPGLRVRFGELGPDAEMRAVHFVTEDHFCVYNKCVRLIDGKAIPRGHDARPVRLVPAEDGPDLQPWVIGPLRWAPSH